MPGLPKRQNHDGFDAYFDQHEADITSPLLPTKAARQSPMRLMIQDAGVLLTMLPYLPNIFLPLKAKDSSDELYMNMQGARDTTLQGWLMIMETSVLLMAPLALLILPGLVSMTVIALYSLTVYLVSWPMEGPDVTYSKMDDTTRALAENHRDERWLFVNGTATGYGISCIQIPDSC